MFYKRMNSKDSNFEKFKHELKHFFKNNKNPSQCNQINDNLFTMDVEKDLNNQLPLNVRLKTIQELNSVVLHRHLDDYTIEKLCYSVEDILDHPDASNRQVVLVFLKQLIQGQYGRLGILRRHFFSILKKHANESDFACMLDIFQSLTEYGKDVLYFEDEVGPFLLEHLDMAITVGKAHEFFQLVINVIKYNASYMSDSVVEDIIQSTSFMCCHSDIQQVVIDGLNILDTIVCYCSFAPNVAPVFIGTLCRTVNVEVYSVTSWKIMRNLLGTHLGHATICRMFLDLQDDNSYEDIGFIRGIVFSINMALWSNKCVGNLRITLPHALDKLQKPARSNNSLVVKEIAVGMKWLIGKSSDNLNCRYIWDKVHTILWNILMFIEVNNNNVSCAKEFHEIIDAIENMIDRNAYCGSTSKFFQIIERCSASRPESSVFRLMYYLFSEIKTARDWVEKLNSFLTRYYLQESRANVRIKALERFMEVFLLHRLFAEKDLILIAVNYFGNVAAEENDIVQNSTTHLLVNMCFECNVQNIPTILDIFDSILERPFQLPPDVVLPENKCLCIRTVIAGLKKIFITMLFVRPPTSAVKILSIYVTFLKRYYKRPELLEYITDSKIEILQCLLNLRANSEYHLGYADHFVKPAYSSYLIIDVRKSLKLSSSMVSPLHYGAAVEFPTNSDNENYLLPDVSFISLSDICSAIVTALRCERDWIVLCGILKLIPDSLKHKALLLSKDSRNTDQLVATLCSMINDKHLALPESLKNTPKKFLSSDFQSHVFPVLAAFSSYHTHLDLPLQQRLIKSLTQQGLVSRSAPQCISALTSCILEMHDLMVKLLPEVLLNLSKISATVHIAGPILEFLSMLTTFPSVFSNFVPEQYMAVFAVSLPYTNPFKYNHYIVSLAHHVIAVWFLRCKRPLRKDFVKFIIRGLRANTLVPFAEGPFAKDNEDSADRKRSSSLTERGSKRRERLMSSGHKNAEKPKSYESLVIFHKELTETCIDLMARYTYSTCSAVTKRTGSAELMFNEGHSTTWVVGTKLVTITTSGCTCKPVQDGLCATCIQKCAFEVPIDSAEATLDEETKNSTSYLPLLSTPRIEHSSAETVNNGNKISKVIPDNRLCNCWCQGWAEIRIRRPTGDMAWVMRIQNDPDICENFDFLCDTSANDILLLEKVLNERSDLFAEKSNNTTEDEVIKTRSDIYCTPDRIEDDPITRAENEDDPFSMLKLKRAFSDPVKTSLPVNIMDKDKSTSSHFSSEYYDPLEEDDYVRARNPVQRSNSSPEMSDSWKSRFSKDSSSCIAPDFISGNIPEVYYDSKKVTKSNMRGNCEAIEEEIPGQGNTPPSNNPLSSPSFCLGNTESSTDVVVTSSSATNDNRPEDSLLLQNPAFSRKNSLPSSYVRNMTAKLHPKELVTDVTPESALLLAKFQDDLSPFVFSRSASVSHTARLKRSFSITSNALPSYASSHPHLETKPPPISSPTSLSSRINYKPSKDNAAVRDLSSELNRDTQQRNRVHTVSVMNSSVPKTSRIAEDLEKQKESPNESRRNSFLRGLNASCIFLQLYHSSYGSSSSEKPLLVPATPLIQRSIGLFDLIPPYETHKVGVIYVGPGQANAEVDILRNQCGSVRYINFLQRLGTLIKLSDTDPQNTFLGGLERNGNDGEFAYIWKDEVMQVIFHVATLMPNEENDALCNNKKKHIGNDHVAIVYNESGEEFNLNTVKCQFIFACIVVEPLDHGNSQVSVKAREDLLKLVGNIQPKIIADPNASILARQLALHTNLSSTVLRSLHNEKSAGTYASNWLERLRKIKQIKNKVTEHLNKEAAAKNRGVMTSSADAADDDNIPSFAKHLFHKINMSDFTEYT